MRVILIGIVLTCLSGQVFSQLPCSGPEYRKLDFWIGEWDVYGKAGQKVGDSRITLILDSCVIFEEWTSTNVMRGLRYTGKSFNTYNTTTKQWQQTWVDNTGMPIEFFRGQAEDNQLTYTSNPVKMNNDSVQVRRMTFSKIAPDKIRQHAEISHDNGLTWKTNVDLEYRRRK